MSQTPFTENNLTFHIVILVSSKNFSLARILLNVACNVIRLFDGLENKHREES